jgi:hypothetical protein
MTSLPFLEYDDKYFPEIEDRHWHFQLFDFNRVESQKLFHILGLPYKPPVVRTKEEKGSKQKRKRYN